MCNAIYGTIQCNISWIVSNRITNMYIIGTISGVANLLEWHHGTSTFLMTNHFIIMHGNISQIPTTCLDHLDYVPTSHLMNTTLNNLYTSKDNGEANGTVHPGPINRARR